MINPLLLQKHPNLLIGLIVCKDIKNQSSPPELIEFLRAAEAQVRSRFPDPETLKEHPTIAAWQEVHRSFGSNPNKFPSSVHALTKRVAKGASLTPIHALVDAYNIVSLRHMLPVGGEDLDRCKGNIILTFALGNEPFRTIGATEDEPPEVGEVIYRDDEGVLCRKFNWREAARTCLTEATTNAVLVIEAIPPTTQANLQSAMNDLQNLVQKFCGGSLSQTILGKGNPSLGL